MAYNDPAWLAQRHGIDAVDLRPGPGERLDVALVTLLVLLGVALFVYLAYTLISR